MAEILTPKQIRAVELLICGKSSGDLTKELQISRQTLSRWRRSDLFQKELTRAQAESLQELTRRLQSLGHLSVEVIREVLESPTAAATVKLRAASAVLESLLRLREAVDLEQRLGALEEKIK